MSKKEAKREEKIPVLKEEKQEAAKEEAPNLTAASKEEMEALARERLGSWVFSLRKTKEEGNRAEYAIYNEGMNSPVPGLMVKAVRGQGGNEAWVLEEEKQ